MKNLQEAHHTNIFGRWYKSFPRTFHRTASETATPTGARIVPVAASTFIHSLARAGVTGAFALIPKARARDC